LGTRRWESEEQQEAWQLPACSRWPPIGGGIVTVAHAAAGHRYGAAERLLEQTRRRLYQIAETSPASRTVSRRAIAEGRTGNG